MTGIGIGIGNSFFSLECIHQIVPPLAGALEETIIARYQNERKDKGKEGGRLQRFKYLVTTGQT